MKYQIATIALILLIMSGCGFTKKVNNEESKQTSKEMQNKGFLEGEIVFSELEGDCEYTILTKGDEPEYLDPTNLTEENKIDGQLIWFKYKGLREMNRCDKARPVEIIEIELRKE